MSVRLSFWILLFGGFLVLFSNFFHKKNQKHKSKLAFYTSNPGNKVLELWSNQMSNYLSNDEVYCKEKEEGFLAGFSSNPRHGLLSTSGPGITFSKHFSYRGFAASPLQSAAQTVLCTGLHQVMPHWLHLLINWSNPALCSHRHCQKE